MISQKNIFKFFKLIVVVSLVMMLAGCSFGGFDTNIIMKAPRLVGGDSDIQIALEKIYGNDFTFKPPKSGKNTSAIIKRTINCEGSQNAIVCYKTINENKIHMAVFDYSSNKWSYVDKISKEGYEIDTVDFGDVNNDGVDEIIVGWTSITGSIPLITVLDYKGDKLSLLSELEFNYSAMLVGDIDGDGVSEIFTVKTNDKGNNKAYATLLKMDRSNNLFTFGEKCRVCPNIRYISLLLGKVDECHTGVFMDGDRFANEKRFVTDIVYWNDETKKLVAPYVDNYPDIKAPIRYTNDIAKDIDGDGVIEVPCVNSLDKYYAEGAQVPAYFVNWSKFNIQSNDYTVVKSYIFNCFENYGIIASNAWFSNNSFRVVVNVNIDLRTMMFYEVNASNKNQKKELFEIKAFTCADWENFGSEYTKILEISDRIYGVKYFSTNNVLILSIDDLRDSFIKLN